MRILRTIVVLDVLYLPTCPQYLLVSQYVRMRLILTHAGNQIVRSVIARKEGQVFESSGEVGWPAE